MQTLTNTNTSLSAPGIRAKEALDFAGEYLRDGQIAFALDSLFDDLLARRSDEPVSWPSYAKSCLNHPLRVLLHQDPFTYRAFSKLRGYAGDAVMMDYIYGLGEAEQAARYATPLGLAIFNYMGGRPSARGVRYRRELIAGLIDRVAANGGTKVLALAAGHLREAALSRAVRSGALEDFVAFDQDETSLAVVARDYACLGVRTVAGSVKQILAGTVAPLGQFDFVYAAGLFDYLKDSAAEALAYRIFEMTRPGGLVLIPNFLPGVKDRGYMESFMDWHLIYRDHAAMCALAAGLPPGAIEDCRIFDDPDEAITYLLVSKAR